MERITSKSLQLSLNNDKDLEKVVKALSNKTRRDILRLLRDGPKNINNISFELDLPISTVSEHVSELVKSGICSVARVINDRGQSKVITRQYEDIDIHIIDNDPPLDNRLNFRQDIPIGSYTSFYVHKYGGMASSETQIGERDNPNNFYHPNRLKAQLIWFDYGYLEYSVPLPSGRFQNIEQLSFSFEICSEAPNYCEDWKSDIYFEINGIEVGTYLSLGDYGERHGVLTPSWWTATQYGMLKTLNVKKDGTYIDGAKASNVTLKDIDLESTEVIKFRIGVKENAKNRGGLNIFGKKFGDHPQDIIMTISHR